MITAQKTPNNISVILKLKSTWEFFKSMFLNSDTLTMNTAGTFNTMIIVKKK